MQILDFGQVDFRYFKGWVRDLNMDVQKIKFIKQTINKPKLITLHFISFVLIVGQILYMVSTIPCSVRFLHDYCKENFSIHHSTAQLFIEPF